jgi:hypothetical protein
MTRCLLLTSYHILRFALQFISCSSYTASNDKMISDMYGIGRARRWPWPTLRHYLGMYLDGPRKATQMLSSRPHDIDIKQESEISFSQFMGP